MIDGNGNVCWVVTRKSFVEPNTCIGITEMIFACKILLLDYIAYKCIKT